MPGLTSYAAKVTREVSAPASLHAEKSPQQHLKDDPMTLAPAIEAVPSLPPAPAGEPAVAQSADAETARLLREYLDAHHAQPERSTPPWRRVRVGRAKIDCLSYDQAVAAVCEVARVHGRREYVVTPNIQHVAMLRRGGEFEQAYDDAALVLPDGFPVALTLRALTGRKQSRVTGADLLPGICRAAAKNGLTIGLLGGRPGAAEEAAWRLTADYPGLNVTLVEEAPYGFDAAQDSLDRVLDHVADRDPDILFVGLGAPKGELFLQRHRDRLGNGIALSVGAAIDFAAGVVDRAPAGWQRLGFEWLYRIVQEPRRLMRRYAVAAPLFVLAALQSLAAAHVRRR
jgi:N-acetylglucosaminyldiphosphoundecaprenol N-acetyl-beta-D-mannosaminyltransferase